MGQLIQPTKKHQLSGRDMQHKILLTRKWPTAVEDYLRSRYDVTFNTSSEPMTESELREAASNFDVLLTTTSERLTANVFLEPHCKVRLICNFGVGYDHIDVAACRASNIIVTNTPDVLTDATAEIAIMLMLVVARRAGDGERALRSARSTDCMPTQSLGTQVTGKTLGLVGFGRIGQATAAIAHQGLGMKILYHARHRVAQSIEDSLQAQYCKNIDELLANADFVSLHCPGGAATENLLDAQRLKQMKRSAFLINTSRGSVIDEGALVDALRSSIIAGAGLDVYRNEPNVHTDLLIAPNTVLLPHIGSATTETRLAMGMRAVKNLEQWLEGRDPPDRIT